MEWLRQKYWHELFEAGVLLKALNSTWETLGGIFLLTRLHSWIPRAFIFLSHTELIGDQDDLIFRTIKTQIGNLNVVDTRTFVGIYLLFHGIVNMFLAYNLYRNRLWAYPTMIGFVSVFLLYQVYRLLHTQSPLLLIITLFDIFFVVLTWHEYRYQKKKRG